MQVGEYKLISDSLAAHIILEASCTFVVNHLELEAKAPIGELGMEDGVWEHKDGSSDSVLGRSLSTSCQPHGDLKCVGRRSSHKLGL